MPADVLWAFGGVLGVCLAAFLLAWFGTDTKKQKRDEARPAQR